MADATAKQPKRNEAVKINETWEYQIEKMWKAQDQAMSYLIKKGIGPSVTIYPVLYLLELFQRRTFRERAELQQLIFFMMEKIKTAERLDGLEGRGFLKSMFWSPEQRKTTIRLRPMRCVKKEPKLAAELLNKYKPAAKEISSILADNNLLKRTALAVLAILLVQYRFGLGLSMRAAKNDIIAMWDFCEEMRRKKNALN